MSDILISQNEFEQFRALMRRVAGVELSPQKKSLVSGRLGRRLRALGLVSFGEYFRLVAGGTDPQEYERMVDLLTTHETYFFREPGHFDYLADVVLPQLRTDRRSVRVWSAASSSGEEAYSLAMVLADRLGIDAQWEVFASDISREVVDKARGGIYAMQRIDGIPSDYLRRFCLRGVGSREGTLQVDPELRRRVRFAQVNLNEQLARIGDFDVIFLRNVLIYFDLPTKRRIVERVARQLRPGGWLFIGHSESLNGLDLPLSQARPTIYRPA
ncbi:CheR family methyltransferase [Azoarcus taiwanensis]|uniref:Chemotaxis protein methyltransferase n=1 Tax=Azoarcus taiwanensis TaxID=666964 RepID=A0A972F8Y6_9RHOO|nr:protein-glutamate O-methyltransferase CheR [Azoarcus taiwanensis]NMG03935.1 methyltransferase domain-containing protein [Azoarcus taiwanensis]